MSEQQTYAKRSKKTWLEIMICAYVIANIFRSRLCESKNTNKNHGDGGKLSHSYTNIFVITHKIGLAETMHIYINRECRKRWMNLVKLAESKGPTRCYARMKFQVMLLFAFTFKINFLKANLTSSKLLLHVRLTVCLWVDERWTNVCHSRVRN